MKKTLLLSVVASTMIMAGGDIAPVEPVVETPMVAAATSGWDFGGQAVAYTQTVDEHANGSLFDSGSTYAAIGAQLRATNKDIFAGIGAGVEVSAIHSDDGATGPTLASPKIVSPFYNNGGNGGKTSGGITQAYLTYGMGATSLKVGRQTLPKSLSPFAYSEGWQMFKNTFDAALVVNSSIPDTTLVYAYVVNANRSVGAHLNEDSFDSLKVLNKLAIEDNTHMVTAQTKAISGVTLTGTFYQMTSVGGGDDAQAVWVDAKTKIAGFGLALQGGQIFGDAVDGVETSAFGAKISTTVAGVNLSAAYSTVSDGLVGITNLGTNVKSPLYTQMVLNNVGNYHAAADSDFVKLFATTKALGGTVKVGYGQGLRYKGDDNRNATEFDLMYVTKLTKNTKVFAAYVNTDPDLAGADSNNFVRVWARYSF